MASEIQILDAFSKPPRYKTVTILLLGCQVVDKQKLARALLKTDAPCSVYIRTAHSLPLPKETEQDRPRIDFICFIIDLTSKESLKVMEDCLRRVDVEYFLGRSCLVAGQVQDTAKHIIDVEHVMDLAEKFHLQALFVDPQEEAQLSAISERIIQLVLNACSFKHHVTPAVIESTKGPTRRDRL